MFDAIVTGYAVEDVNYCPKCGGRVYMQNAAGYCTCEECGYKFAVIESEDWEDEE